MDAVPSIRPLGLICGVLSIVQSIIWIALSTFLLLISYCVIPIHLNDDSKPFQVSNPYLYFLFTRYLRDEDCDDTVLTLPNQPEITYLVQPYIFRIWLWFYFGLSIAWFILSCFLIKITSRKQIPCLNSVVFIWFITVIEICGMDCALSIVFGLDIANLQNHYDGEFKFDALVAAITMFCIFSRGVFIWVINLSLAIGLFYSTLTMPHAKNNHTLMDTTDDDHTSYSSKFGTTTFRNHPSQWQPPIDAFTYSNNTLKPPDTPINRMRVEMHASHPGWTLRRDNSTSNHKNVNGIDNNSSLSFNNNSYRQDSEINVPYHNTDINIPSPDYSPVLQRVPSFNMTRRKSSNQRYVGFEKNINNPNMPFY